MESDAPEWLIELIANQSRLMSSSPKSVADAVWWDLQRREIVVIEGPHFIRRNAKGQITDVISMENIDA